MKTLALSTAILALLSGASLAQTAPESSSPTTGTGAPQAPMTGNDASPSANPVNTGNTGGDPAMNSTQTPATPSEAPSTPEPSNTPAPMGTEANPNTNTTDTGAATGNSAAAETSDMTPPEGFAPVMAEEVTADMLNDVTVYDSEESSVGTIDSVMPETGTPAQVIVDVGGFLGIGAKPVSLNVSELMFFKENDGDEVRAYTSMTEEQIQDLPEHEG